MPFNDFGFTFSPVTLNAPMPTLTTAIPGWTTAQLNANGTYTTKSITASTSILVDAAKIRTTGITVVVPIDQPAVFLDNSPLVGPFPNWLSLASLANGSTATNATGLSSGLFVAPGNSVFLAPYYDPMYAYAVGALASTIFYADT